MTVIIGKSLEKLLVPKDVQQQAYRQKEKNLT